MLTLEEVCNFLAHEYAVLITTTSRTYLVHISANRGILLCLASIKQNNKRHVVTN